MLKFLFFFCVCAFFLLLSPFLTLSEGLFIYIFKYGIIFIGIQSNQYFCFDCLWNLIACKNLLI